MEKRLIKLLGVYPITILSMVFWGMSFVWTSIVFRYYHPITTILFRLVISSVILLIFIRLTGHIERINKEDMGLLFLSALLNPFLYFLGENFGLKYSTPAISSVIIATIPLFTPVAAYLTLREKLSWLNIAGILISFFGIAVMLINPDFSYSASYTGVILLLFAVASAIIYSVLLKKLAMKYSALTIIAYQNSIGVLYFLPLFLIFDLQHFLTVTPNIELITSLISLAVFASSLAYIFYTISVKSIGVSRSNVFSNLIPVFTAVFSYIFIHEIFTVNKLIGMMIVIAGVIIAQLKNLRNIINI